MFGGIKMSRLRFRIFVFSLIFVMLASGISLSTAMAAKQEKHPNTHTNTGDHRVDIVSVAKTQIGYREGDNNDTKYGTWYGFPNQPWCAMFVSWCARQAEIPLDVLTNCAIAAPDSGYFNIRYFDGENYTPEHGDLFFTKTFSHVGIVDYVDGENFYTVEGNTNDTGGDIGIGVFALKRTVADYYFGVPDYNYKSKNHTCNFAVYSLQMSEHPHYIEYICSYCGALNFDSDSVVFTEDCDICRSEAMCLLGDVNGDMNVNIKDATMIQKHLAEILYIDEQRLSFSDTDMDAQLTIKDATLIQKYLSGIITDSSVGKVLKKSD